MVLRSWKKTEVGSAAIKIPIYVKSGFGTTIMGRGCSLEVYVENKGIKGNFAEVSDRDEKHIIGNWKKDGFS